MASHLGVHPADHVLLHRTGNGDWERILPSGIPAPSPFFIPKDHYLVITDVDWQFSARMPMPRQNVTLRLSIAPLRDLANRYSAFESTVQMDDSSYGGASEAMTAGFVVDDSATILAETVPYPETISDLLLRGYLIDK